MELSKEEYVKKKLEIDIKRLRIQYEEEYEKKYEYYKNPDGMKKFVMDRIDKYERTIGHLDSLPSEDDMERTRLYEELRSTMVCIVKSYTPKTYFLCRRKDVFYWGKFCQEFPEMCGKDDCKIYICG